MGYYINPPDSTKEAFLERYGTPISPAIAKQIWKEEMIKTHLPICLVDNGQFTAAGIAYSERETDYFLEPDGRPKLWFVVPRKELTPYIRADLL